MILCDREIKAAIARQVINISPFPEPTAWTSTAVDLRLASEISFWKKPSIGGVSAEVCPFDQNYNFAQLQKDFSESASTGASGFILKSGAFILGWTIERIQLPHRSRLAARVEGKSSLARLGVGVHVTAPTIHAGFGYKPGDSSFQGSPIQLEIWNAGPLDIRLNANMPICQLIFEWVDGTPERGYEGRFSIQGPEVPK